MEIKQLENSEIEIIDEIPWEKVVLFRARALKHISEDVELPGFRKGHIPEDILVKKIGEAAVVEEMARHAISDYYLATARERKIDAIGKPNITVTKLAPGNPLGFSIKTAVLPIVNLPDVKELAKKVYSVPEPSFEPTDEELQKAIDAIRKHNATSNTPAGGETPPEKAENHPLPELTDETVKGWGPFATVDAFREAVKNSIADDKRHVEKEKRRGEIVDAILSVMHLIVPKILVDAEMDRMLAQFKDRISGMGMNPRKYFEHIKKTEDEVRQGWVADAEKRVKSEMVLRRIAEQESITGDDAEIDALARQIKERYADASDDRARGFAAHAIETEKVFQFLEAHGVAKV